MKSIRNIIMLEKKLNVKTGIEVQTESELGLVESVWQSSIDESPKYDKNYTR